MHMYLNKKLTIIQIWFVTDFYLKIVYAINIFQCKNFGSVIVFKGCTIAYYMKQSGFL